MKQLILLFLCCKCWAGQFSDPHWIGRLVFSSSSGPTNCFTPADGNLFNEGFEGTGFENPTVWSITPPNLSAYPDYDLSVFSSLPAGMCSQALSGELTPTDRDPKYAHSLFFSPPYAETTYYRFYFYIGTTSINTPGQKFYIFAICQGGSTAYRSLAVYLGYYGGQPHLYLEGKSLGSGAFEFIRTPVALQTWNYVDIKWSNEIGQCNMKLNGGPEGVGISRTSYLQGDLYLGSVNYLEADVDGNYVPIHHAGVIIDKFSVSSAGYIGP